MKSSRVFWGLFLILGAIFGLAAQMGLVQGVGGWAIFGTVLFVALLVKSIMNRSFFGIFFSIAFIAIIYAEQLGITAITPWPILGAALCLSIGCGWLFPNKHNWKKYIHGNINKADHRKHGADGIVIDKDGNEIHIGDGVNVTVNGGTKTATVNGEEINIEEGYCEEETVEKNGGDWVNLTQVFQSTTKYINSNNFAGLNAECVFCKVEVFFDGAGMQGTTATANIENVFSTTMLYVPKTWTVKESNENVFANYSESGSKNPDGVHTLILNCENVFGSVKVIYV